MQFHNRLTNTCRPMYLQHASAPGRHLQPVTQPRRPRARKRRARCVVAVLEPGKEIMYTRDYEPPSDARRGYLLMCLESGRTVGSERRWRRSGQGICTVVLFVSNFFTFIGVGHERGPFTGFVSIGMWRACLCHSKVREHRILRRYPEIVPKVESDCCLACKSGQVNVECHIPQLHLAWYHVYYLGRHVSRTTSSSSHSHLPRNTNSRPKMIYLGGGGSSDEAAVFSAAFHPPTRIVIWPWAQPSHRWDGMKSWIQSSVEPLGSFPP